MDDELQTIDMTLSRSTARWATVAAAGIAIAALWAMVLVTNGPMAPTSEAEQVVDAQVAARNFQYAVSDLRASGAAFAASGDLSRPPASYQTALADLTSAMEAMGDTPAIADADRDRWRETAMGALTAATDLQAQLSAGGTEESARRDALDAFEARMAGEVMPDANELSTATFADLRTSRDDAATASRDVGRISLIIAAIGTLLAVAAAWLLPSLLARREDLSEWMDLDDSANDDFAPITDENVDPVVVMDEIVDQDPGTDENVDPDVATDAVPPVGFGVAAVSALVAQSAGFDRDLVRKVAVAGCLCDARLDAALAAASADDRDWDAFLDEHSDLAARGIDVQDLESVADWVRHRPERWDGSGKPDGLAADSIPIPSRILHAVTVFVIGASGDDAAASDLVANMQLHAGTRLDARIVMVMEQLVVADSMDELRDGLDNHAPIMIDAVVETVCNVSNPLRDDTAA